jgi:hypothetical protein
MREERARWHWLPRSRLHVFPQPGHMANAAERPHPVLLPRVLRILPPHVLNPPGLSQSGLNTRPVQPRNPRVARKGTLCSVRHMGIRRSMRAPLIRFGPIRGQATRALPFQGMRPPSMLLRNIWATGSISTAIFLYRIRSGYCAATPTSGASTRRTSNG